MPEKKYPISEIFTSIQGEGRWSGTVMTFVRTAGCSVGKSMEDEDPLRIEASRNRVVVSPWVEKCTLWDGRKFLCDTDFRRHKFMTVGEILSEVPMGVERLCITGGEPLNHDLDPLVEAAGVKLLRAVHIETSGTVPVSALLEDRQEAGRLWLTVSPKYGVLPEVMRMADEVKFLVDAHFDAFKIPEIPYGAEVYIQPVNDEFDINKENLDRCIALVHRFPQWKLSVQLHKVARVR